MLRMHCELHRHQRHGINDRHQRNGTALTTRLERGTIAYSHSMVPGGLEVMSYTTRLTPLTSLMILFDMVSNSS